MRILSSSEVEELCEHLVLRTDIWILHNGVWIRKMRTAEQEEIIILAIKISNGLPGEMWGLTTKAVGWSKEAVEQYVDWLLEKYTAYHLRMQIVALLSPAIKNTTDVHSLSRDLCELQGGVFVRKKENTSGSTQDVSKAVS